MIDSHLHLVTAEMIGDISARCEKNHPGFGKSLVENAHHLINDKFIEYLSSISIEDFAKRWITEMDENGIDKAVFFPISERPEQMAKFVAFSPERFIGYAYLGDPLLPDAASNLKRQVEELGMKGLKLYPCLQLFNAYDEAVFPVYEMAQSLGIPITFHMGITHAPVSDYRYTNPIDLQLPLKLFPKLNFIIAHFGAGFFREVCLLGFHSHNLYVDSSGTNNWREYTPEQMELKDVFKRTIEIFGASKVLFGTDTVLKNDTGYRTAIMKEQKEIIHSVCKTKAEAEMILTQNALELFE